MKRIAPLFFILCLVLGLGIFVRMMRHRPKPIPNVAFKHPSVSAQKGPLKLTLTLYSDTVPRNGPLWFRLSVTNIGKKPFNINDPIFAPYFLDDGKNFIDYLALNSGMKKGFYLVVLDDKGKRVGANYSGTPPLIDFDPCTMWKYGNWPFSKFADIRDDLAMKRDLAEQKFKSFWPHVVSPGESIETIAWSYHGYCDSQRAHPPTPPGRFAEYYKLDINQPGTYKIYAGLNHVPTKKEMEERKGAERVVRRIFREQGWKYHANRAKPIQTPEDLVVKTPAITFEVLP